MYTGILKAKEIPKNRWARICLKKACKVVAFLAAKNKSSESSAQTLWSQSHNPNSQNCYESSQFENLRTFLGILKPRYASLARRQCQDPSIRKRKRWSPVKDTERPSAICKQKYLKLPWFVDGRAIRENIQKVDCEFNTFFDQHHKLWLRYVGV